jgi:hypothetical protein
MKSGSTWITQIIQMHGRWSPIPDHYRNQEWFNPSLAPERYSEFFGAREFAGQDWFCKQHWRSEGKYYELLRDENIRVINIVRDLRDVLVSRFYHDLRLGQASADNIAHYYFRENGRKKLQGYMEYHRFWHHPEIERQPFLSVFEYLITDFATELQRLFDYIGEPLSQSDIARIHRKTSFENKKVTGEGNFFRKGIIGDWRNHLTSELLEDIGHLMAVVNYPHRKLQASFDDLAQTSAIGR